MAPAKPTIIPYWTDGAANKVAQPTAAAQAQGFTAGQPPPFEYVNWLFYEIGQWVGYLNEATNATTMSTSLNDLMRLVGGGRWGFTLASGTLSWSAPFNLSFPTIADSANQCAAGSVVLGDGQIAYVAANIPFTTQGDIAQESNQITNLNYEIGIVVGQAVIGNGIAQGTVVTAVDGDTVTLSDNATASATGETLTFSGSGALSVQVATGQSFVPGPNTVILARRVGSVVYVGANTGQMVLRDGELKGLCETGYLNLASRTAGMPLPIRAPVYVSQGGSDATVVNTGLASGSTSATVADATGLYAGMGVAGSGIPTGTTIVGVNGTTVTLSAAATASSTSATLTYTRVANRLYACDASIVNGPSRAGFVGFTVAAFNPGDMATYAAGGAMGGFAGLTAGATYYVDPATPGAMTLGRPSVPGQTIAPVGTALGNTTLSINPCGAAANQVVTSILAWANYSARNEGEFAAAIQAATTVGGGVILIVNAMTLSANYTVPNGTVIVGRKGASTLTMLAGGTLTMADGAEVRDLWFASSAAGSTLVQMGGDANVIRACSFNLTPNNNIVGVNVTGSGNRIYNCAFMGVSNGSTNTGILYTSGARNIDDSTYIVS